MAEVKIRDKGKVLPGDILAEGTDYIAGRGCFKEDDVIKSNVLGVVRKKENLFRVVPMAGIYIPQEGDKIIGKVSGVQASSWWVDLNSPYDGYLSLSEGSDEFIDLDETELADVHDIGDIIYTEVVQVTRGMDVKLSMDSRMCKKLSGGTVERMTPAKVPRLIGKGGSMVEMIKEKTDTHIIIGQNGIVWISGGDMETAAEAVRMVDERSHEEGLTEKIKEFLEG